MQWRFSPIDMIAYQLAARITPCCRPHIHYARLAGVKHPDPHGPPDRTSIEIGEVWENPVTRERATILERTWDNPAGRATAELTALVGARVMGEHRHPALVERFTPIEGELTVKRNGRPAFCIRARRPSSSPTYGTTGGMRAIATCVYGWRSHPASGSCT